MHGYVRWCVRSCVLTANYTLKDNVTGKRELCSRKRDLSNISQKGQLLTTLLRGDASRRKTDDRFEMTL